MKRPMSVFFLQLAPVGEPYEDFSIELGERILQDPQFNMVEFAKKYFREAVRKSRLDVSL